MTLREFLDEYDNLSVERKRSGVKKFLLTMVENSDYFEYTLHDWMVEVLPDEALDIFGTEGMDI